jgi:hypothetical protein
MNQSLSTSSKGEMKGGCQGRHSCSCASAGRGLTWCSAPMLSPWQPYAQSRIPNANSTLSLNATILDNQIPDLWAHQASRVAKHLRPRNCACIQAMTEPEPDCAHDIDIKRANTSEGSCVLCAVHSKGCYKWGPHPKHCTLQTVTSCCLGAATDWTE